MAQTVEWNYMPAICEPGAEHALIRMLASSRSSSIQLEQEIEIAQGEQTKKFAMDMLELNNTLIDEIKAKLQHLAAHYRRKKSAHMGTFLDQEEKDEEAWERVLDRITYRIGIIETALDHD